MRKSDIQKLINCGIVSMTAHDLAPMHAYKAFNLKRKVEKINEDIVEEQKKLAEQYGLTDELKEKVQKIITKAQKNEALSADETKTLEQYNGIIQTVEQMIVESLKEDVELDVKTIPYEEWRKLQAENRAKKIGEKEVDILGGIAELILADVFWREPEEAESKEKEDKE
jgi:hypothetical protein